MKKTTIIAAVIMFMSISAIVEERTKSYAMNVDCSKCYSGKCDYCNGSGVVDGNPQKLCPNHTATYINHFNIPTVCKTCGGGGRVVDTSITTKDCPECKGTGKCIFCNGTGFVEN